jgi:hypothetical protein
MIILLGIFFLINGIMCINSDGLFQFSWYTFTPNQGYALVALGTLCIVMGVISRTKTTKKKG